MRGRALALALLGWAGCGGDGLVVLHISDGTGGGLAPAAIEVRLVALAPPDLRRDATPIRVAPAASTIGLPTSLAIDIPAAEAGDVSVVATALDGNNAPLAAGEAAGHCAAGQRLDLDLRLGGGGPGVDAGADLARLDGALSDLGPSGDLGPAPGCEAHPSALFCEDFEGGLQDFWSPLATVGGKVMIQSARAHSGRSALFATVGAHLNSLAKLRTTEAFAHAHRGVHLRAYVQVFDTAPGFTGTLLSFLEGVAPFGGIGLDYIDSSAHNAALLGWGRWSTIPYPIEDNGRPGLLAQDAWHCVELLLLGGGGQGGEVQVWIDGAPVPALGQTGLAVNDLVLLDVGLAVSVDGPAASAAIDDIVVSTSPIGCD